MLFGEAKLARTHAGLPFFAEVALDVDFSTKRADIRCACTGSGFVSQGQVEEASAIGYDDWKAGASAGVSFALAIAAQPPACVTIRRITGMSTDTNPAIVGAAAALATWQAIGFPPAADVVKQLEATVFMSWQRPPHEVLNFGEGKS